MGKITNNKKSPVSIQIVGLILSESYQKCKIFVQKLRKRYDKKFSEPVIKGYLEMDWVDYLSKLRKEIGGETWAVKKGVVVFLDGVFLGGEVELFSRFSLFVCEPPTEDAIKKLATREYLSYLKQNNLLYTYFELSLDGVYMGSLLFELRVDLLPKTAVWFAMICDSNNHLGFSYKNSKIHRVCQRGWFQGGKLALGDVAGFLEDESFCYKHDRRGILSMANHGKDSNRVQFFVTFKPSQWMDEYYVAFGRVVEGSDVLRRLEYTKCTYEHPDHVINIDNCGIVGVGFGKSMKIQKTMKGITVGDPHIHLETFMDMVLERFDEILFDRLEDEVKRELDGEWMAEMIWKTIQPHLLTREPIEDVLDVNDRSSKNFDPAVFIKGLYGLKEIPDHFIMELLDEIIADSVDVVDTREMVESIINLLVDNLDLEGLRDEVRAKSLVSSVVTTINTIVYGQEKSMMTLPNFSTSSKKELFQRSIYKVASQTPTIRKLLTEYSTYSISQASYSPEEEVRESSLKVFTDDEEQFQKGTAHVPTISKLLTDYKTLSVSRDSVQEEGVDERVEEKKATEILLQGSISDVVSHTSTVRKLMTDYKRFSDERKSLRHSLTIPSTRESIIGYIWETLFKSLFKE